MKFATACLLVLLLVPAAQARPSLGQLAEEPYPVGPDRLGEFFRQNPELRSEPGSGWKPYNRMISFLGPRTAPGENAARLRWQAWEDTRGRLREGAGLRSAWFSTGPVNFSGRANGVAIDPTNSSVVYVSTAGGGLWKTTDGGDTWLPLTDDQASTHCGAVAVLPWAPDVVLLGLGEGTLPAFADLNSPFGAGLIRSTDGGATWAPSGLTASAGTPNGFHVIEANATSQVILAGTSSGLFRSTDDGQSWVLVEGGNAVFDVKWKPGDPATVFIAKGQDPFINAGPDLGVKISTDGGLTFQLAGTGQPTSLALGKTKLGVTAADPDVIYAHYVNTATFNTVGVYRSTDGGATWSPRNTTQVMTAGQGWYNLVLAVDPDDPEFVNSGGVPMFRSTDGGVSWMQYTNTIFSPAFGDSVSPHLDNHAIVYDPNSTDTIWLATDGGVWKSTDDGLTWRSRREGMVTYQYYDVCVGQTDSAFMVGGTQDNGIPRRRLGVWRETPIIFDGMVCNVDPTDPRVVYAETQNGLHWKSTNRGGNYQQIMTGITGTGFWITAQDHDPLQPNRLYTTTTNGIFRTTDGGALWQNVGAQTARWISMSRAQSGLVWTLSNFSGVFHTTDDGGSWIPSPSFPATGGTEQKIAADPHDPATAYVVYGSYTPGVSHVVRTTDFGVSWHDVTGDFPNVPANTFVADPDRPSEWYVGSDLGVWLSTNEGVNWTPVGSGFPNCAVSDLEIKSPARKLVAATFGRGVWEIDLPATAVNAPEVDVDRARRLLLDDPAPNPVRGETMLRFAARTDRPVTLDLYDVSGRRVKRIERLERGDGIVRERQWRAAEVPAGVYFLVLRSDGEQRSRKMIVTR